LAFFSCRVPPLSPKSRAEGVPFDDGKPFSWRCVDHSEVYPLRNIQRPLSKRLSSIPDEKRFSPFLFPTVLEDIFLTPSEDRSSGDKTHPVLGDWAFDLLPPLVSFACDPEGIFSNLSSFAGPCTEKASVLQRIFKSVWVSLHFSAASPSPPASSDIFLPPFGFCGGAAFFAVNNLVLL